MDEDERKARLAQALRQNLRRRKAQARDMGDAPRDDAPGRPPQACPQPDH